MFANRICTVIAEARADRLIARLHAIARRSRKSLPTIEIRLDWLASRAELEEALAKLRRVLATGPGRRLYVIATLRRREGGGKFRASPLVQRHYLVAAARAGCRWCDLEVESAAGDGGFGKETIRELRGAGARVLISFHDFQQTPRDLRRVVAKLKARKGDAIKIAAHCRTLGDSARVLNLLQSTLRLVAIPMGDEGLPGRLLALGKGSALAYAALDAPTAPGQLSVREMRDLYRVDQVNGRTLVYGVIGDPVLHSLSPAAHNAGYIARGLNAIYVPIPVRDLDDFLEAVKPLGLRGFSLTLPHKESLLEHLKECDPLAARIGAVNTVKVGRNGALHGYNTDYAGVLRALEPHLTLRGSRILLLGAGGAARAAAFALVDSGAEVFVCARRPRKAAELARAVGGTAIARSRAARERFAAIVNATPVGLKDSSSSPLEAREIHCDVAMDMVYRPLKTRFLRLAEARGARAVSGVEMFVAQAAAQWEIWFGNAAPVNAMRRAVLESLRAETKRTR